MGGFFISRRKHTRMNRYELITIVKQSSSTTLIARRMREALGLPQPSVRGHYRDKHAKRRKYRGARKLMKQRHGVRL